VAHPKTLNILLAEDNLEDEYLIREALIEIEDNCLWGRWSNCMLTQVDQLHDAVDCLQAAPFDAILLNLTLPDASNLLDTFLRVQAAASGTAVLVLSDDDDPMLAAQLVREGAQDVIVKSEIECIPLSRAIRNGIERTRRQAALEKRVLIDPLTGVQNRFGFLELGAHYLKLARITGIASAFLLVQFRPEPDENLDLLDLLLIRATEVSRAIFPDGTLIGRLRPASLGILAIGVTETQAQALAERLRIDLYSAFPNTARPGFVIIEAESGGWSNMEDLLDRPRKVERISGMLSG
jgi:CheY-like chemotaxis protein/GGDEF domain-containing protein